MLPPMGGYEPGCTGLSSVLGSRMPAGGKVGAHCKCLVRCAERTGCAASYCMHLLQRELPSELGCNQLPPQNRLSAGISCTPGEVGDMGAPLVETGLMGTCCAMGIGCANPG